ncbi:MAG: preprotein translocase subunit SecG [Salinisphaera sp.]|nr:preprotein translocase subunit SecG [Salinisphaera sp.]MBS63956.1 preprotein translocase subunit SecG [Salinisphaera sp.]
MVYTILVVIQVVVALALIGLILVQHGKGADAGAAFGSGASGTVFGAKGSANFMTRATASLATVFFAISLTLAYLINGASTPTGSVTDQVQQQAPGSSLLSDGNNNGVAGDEVVTGEGSNTDADNENQGAPADNGSAAPQVPGDSGDDADTSEPSAQVPE